MALAQVGEQYRHYKGSVYTVIGIATHSESMEPLVIYKSEADTTDYPKGSLWARPKEMFEGTIMLDGKEVDRFSRIENTA